MLNFAKLTGRRSGAVMSVWPNTLFVQHQFYFIKHISLMISGFAGMLFPGGLTGTRCSRSCRLGAASVDVTARQLNRSSNWR